MLYKQVFVLVFYCVYAVVLFWAFSLFPCVTAVTNVFNAVRSNEQA